MPSILNATTTNGLVTSADNSGSLQLQTNNGTTAVTIDTSQRVGIGTTSPTTQLQVVGSGSGTFSPYNDPFIVQASAGGYTYMQLVGVNNQAGIIYNRNGSTGWFAGLDNNGNLKYSYMSAMNGTALGNAKDSGTPALLLDTSSRVGINSNTAAYIGNEQFIVAGTNTAGQTTATIMQSASSPSGGCNLFLTYNNATPNNTSNSFVICNDSSGVQKLNIYSNGTVSNRTGTYNSLSDAKLKENIVDATPKLDKLMDVKVRNYNLIGDDLKQIGFVAQELEQVFPSLVDNVPDFDEKGELTGEVTKGVKLTVMIPILVKAIQELKAELDATKAEVQALKGAA